MRGEYMCCFQGFSQVFPTVICILVIFILFVPLHNKFNIRITYYNNYIMYTKEKIIQKDRKITRNQKKKQQIVRFQQPDLQKAFKNFHKGNKSLYLDRKLRKNQERAVEDQNVVVNLNLGQYGFDSSIKMLSTEKIEDIITKAQIFSVNPNIEGLEWKQLCCQLANKFQNQNYLIHSKNIHSIYDGKSSKMIEISKEEYNLYDCLHQLFTKIKNGSKSPGLFGAISSETETGRKILLNSKNNITELQYIERWKQIQTYKQQYLKQLAFKTFTYGLRELVIDELNYFLQKQFQQNSRNNRNAKIQVRIKNWEEWSEFIQKKRVRLRKANKFLLHTACQLCLSVYSELQNPIVNCNQCHTRGHKLCLDPNKQNRCGRCIYLRLSNEMKQKIPECFLCSVKNLVPLRINSSKFVHVFCIMAHGMWQLSSFKIVMSNRGQIDSISMEENQVCKFCHKQSQYYTKCENCNSTCHYLCAYMSGAHFQVSEERTVKVYCCQEKEEIMQKQGYQRKYILNYNNLVFKKLNEVQNIVKNRKKQRMKEQQQMENELEMNVNNEYNENIELINFYENENEDNYFQDQRGGFQSS